jgi:ABC-2 type transport system ATP-binding protein
MIRTENLSKQFVVKKKKDPIVAVEGLTLEIPEAEVFGFLGPNGAGKTTTLRMLSSLISPTSGRAWIGDFEVGKRDQDIRRNVGILTETPGMYERLSAEKNLSIFAHLYGVKDISGQTEKYLRMLGLWERRFDDVGSFSKGMRQKLAIARALLHEPKILYLDEPTSGLDPESAKLVRDFIEELKTEGRTIFICTHNLDEAERLCQRIGIFKTRLITVDSPANLRSQLYGRKVVFHLQKMNPRWASLVKGLSFVKDVQAVDDKLVVGLTDPEKQNPVLVKKLVEAGAGIKFVGELKHSLEDVYLELIHEDEIKGKEAV